MPGKNKLDSLLDKPGDASIRRGRGVTLSIDKQPQTPGEQDALVHHRTSAPKPKKLMRINKGYKVRPDIDKELKVLAAEKGRNLYEIMEDALLTYLRKNGKLIS